MWIIVLVPTWCDQPPLGAILTTQAIPLPLHPDDGQTHLTLRNMQYKLAALDPAVDLG